MQWRGPFSGTGELTRILRSFPRYAGIQGHDKGCELAPLDPRFRGDERMGGAIRPMASGF
jgi:hypothetical protein